MRALVIGRGSMGRRRIRDLTALGVEVESWDPKIEEPPLALLTSRILNDPPSPFAFVVVSTPPATHSRFICQAAFTPSFSEADVVETPWPHFPSATPLFTDWYALVRRLLDGEVEPIAYTLHVGQHLDDWHPGADKATYYAYQGDAALREMIPFELIWLTKLFGPVTKVVGSWEPRVASIVVHQDRVIGNLVIDLWSRPGIRTFRMVADGWQNSFDLTYSESAYLEEMRALVAAVKGEAPWPYSQAEEAANLEVLHTIERSG